MNMDNQLHKLSSLATKGKSMKRTFTITDLDGSNPRTHTLKSLRAEIDAAKKTAMEKLRANAKAAGLEIPHQWRA